jgi:heme exporter protein A
VLAGASLSLAPGELALLKGPNGAGKTSLLRALAGLLPLAAGRVRVTGPGVEAPDHSAARRRHCIYAGHADGVKAAMTGGEHLAFWRDLYRAAPARLDAAVAALDLDSFVQRRAGALSAGQRRRLGLARLLVSDKPVWLLDEPTAALDATSAARILDLLAAHARAGGAALIATHDRLALAEARAYAVEAAA